MIDREPHLIDLQRYFVGELDVETAADIELHLDECESCRERLDSLEQGNKAFLKIHPYADFARTLQKEKKTPWFQSTFDLVFKPALIPIYGLLLVMMVISPFVIPSVVPHKSDINFKGQPVLSFLCKREGKVDQGNLSETFRANDEIQVLYSSSIDQYITLVSVDNRGIVSFYNPQQGVNTCSVRSGIGQQLTYPGSIVLDSTPGVEFVVAIFSPSPLDPKKVTEWITSRKIFADVKVLEQGLRANPIAKGAQIATLPIKKG